MRKSEKVFEIIENILFGFFCLFLYPLMAVAIGVIVFIPVAIGYLIYKAFLALGDKMKRLFFLLALLIIPALACSSALFKIYKFEDIAEGQFLICGEQKTFEKLIHDEDTQQAFVEFAREAIKKGCPNGGFILPNYMFQDTSTGELCVPVICKP